MMMQRCDVSLILLSNVVEVVHVRSCVDTWQLGDGKETCLKVISVVNNHTFTPSLRKVTKDNIHMAVLSA